MSTRLVNPGTAPDLLPRAAAEIVGHADIHRSAIAAGEDVDEELRHELASTNRGPGSAAHHCASLVLRRARDTSFKTCSSVP